MTMLLQWRQPVPPIILRWRGPNGSVAAVAAASSPNSIPTLIGPPGPPGLAADIIDGGTF
jgi:hypothetical protein